MLKAIFSVYFILIGSISWGQNQGDANTLFENYEYELAALAYEAKGKKLKKDEKEKLAFCYFRTDNFTKGIPLAKNLIQIDSTSGDYWFWKANLEKEKGDFFAASQSFRKAKHYDNTYDVDILIASCDEIPTWDSIERAETNLYAENDKWANNFSILKGQFYPYFENGKDSASNELSISSQSNSFTELFLMKAFSPKSSGSTPLITDPKLSTHSLSSLSCISNDGTVFFSANDPIAEDNLSHIYEGRLDEGGKISSTSTFNAIMGVSDSSAYAHPAITTDGKTMVFTKMGYTTKGSDLFVTHFINGEWSTPKSLKFLNTEKDEMFPKIIGDSLLTYSSDGKIGYGDLDIYSIPLNEMGSGVEPNHLKAPVNSSGDDFNLEWTSDTTAYFVSNRSNGVGDDDIYELLIKKEIPKQIPALIKVDSAFQNWITKWNNHKVYFDFDKSVAESSLDFIGGILAYAKSKDLTLVITGFTDAEGTDEYNQNLGQRRADWFKSKLTEIGVDPFRISTQSAGELKLTNDCGNDINCDDALQRLNRYVEVSIVSNVISQNSTQVTL